MFSHEDICENVTILDEGIQLCPLCRSEVRLFFINFNEKIHMCENADCEYPFGHEDIMYVKEDNEVQSDEEVASIKGKLLQRSPSATMSTVSTAGWSDIDKINKVYEAEDQLDPKSDTREYYTHKNDTQKIMKAIERQKKIFKQVGVLKNLALELSAQEKEISTSDPEIKNEEWVKNLLSKQQLSGVALLKPEEVKLFKTKQLDLGMGELKIDIDMGSSSNISSIKIELAEKNAACKNVNATGETDMVI